MTDTQDVAARCMADIDFAREILDGDEHPEVREALLADLDANGEVEGFFNPQPEPPGRVMSQKVNRFAPTWNTMSFTHLNVIAKPKK